MKRFLFICVALIAFLATNASGGNMYQTDQLRTCIVQHSPQIMPVMAVNFEPAQAVYNFTSVTLPQTQTITVQTFKSDTWRNPDWGGSLAIMCNDRSIKLNNAYLQLKLPICTLSRNVSNINQGNYNVNYSYGLRY